MSLRIKLTKDMPTTVAEISISHNLIEMAQKVTITIEEPSLFGFGHATRHTTLYYLIWHPNEINKNKAMELQEPLAKCVEMLKKNPEYYKQFNSPTGIGSYEELLMFTEHYLQHCTTYPEAIINRSD